MRFGIGTAVALLLTASVFLGLQFNFRWNIPESCEQYPSTTRADFGFPVPAMRWRIKVAEGKYLPRAWFALDGAAQRTELISIKAGAVAFNFVLFLATLVAVGIAANKARLRFQRAPTGTGPSGARNLRRLSFRRGCL